MMAGVLIFSAPSCDFDDVNIDPTRVSDVELRLILPAALSQTAYNQSANPARIPGIFMQQFVGSDAQQLAYTDYVLEQNTFNNYWSGGLYAGILKDCRVLLDKATETGQPHYEGIAKVLMAESYGMGTSFFGSMPFSQALLGTENLKPAYDTQQQLYEGVQRLLDEAIAALSQPAIPGGPADDDLVFGGDAQMWIKTARALKARYYLHLTKKEGATAASNALAQLNAGTIASQDEQPYFAWETAQTSANPIFLFGLGRTNTLKIDERFATMMDGDPRQDAYMLFNGTDWDFYVGGNATLVWAQNNAAIPLISLAEVKFMEAEALLWTGAGDAEIEAALGEGIQASMDLVGIVDPGEYVTTNSSLAGLTTTEEKLEKIMMEAYKAYYGIAFQQTWTNYRRTGFPALAPSPNGSNGVNPAGGIPRRVLYPNGEYTTNEDNLNAAISAQGADLLDTELWAFQ